MKPKFRFLLSALVAVSLHGSLAAQTFTPQSFKFKGADEYSNAELIAAANLTKGASLTQAQMSDHAKLLMDTGLFTNISFTFNGADLTFEITPSPDLLPVRLENFPMDKDKMLDDQIHAHLPLYHGKVPVQGGLMDDVQKELESQLAARGIQATVTAMPYNDLILNKVTAINFSITSPPVTVGEISLSGASPEQAANTQSNAAIFVGSPYSKAGSANELEIRVVLFYTEQGYLEATAHATAQTATIDPQGVHIPFALIVSEGPRYRLTGIKLAPDMAVTQETFDKQARLRAGDVVAPAKLREEWHFIERQYHNHGLMKAAISPVPAFDHTNGTVSYLVTAVPGPVYTMGTLRVENVADDLRAAIISTWPIPAGSTFNESAITAMTATQGVHPILERVFAATTLRYRLSLHDDVHTVDVILRLEKRHP